MKRLFTLLWDAFRLWKDKTEYRCPRCQEKGKCPARDTGVAYPCPYLKEVPYV